MEKPFVRDPQYLTQKTCRKPQFTMCTVWLPGAHIFGTCAPGECTLFESISIHYIGLNTRKIRREHNFEFLYIRCVYKINALC